MSLVLLLFDYFPLYSSEVGVRELILGEATDILSLVVEELKNHSDNEELVTAGCGLLDALTEAGERERGGGGRGERERDRERGGGGRETIVISLSN